MVARSWPCVTLHTLQGDIHHWIPLLDHFDAFFQQHIQGRHDLQLDYGDADQQGGSPGGAAAAQQQAAGQGGEVAADPVFPTVAVLEVLRVTTLLLEGCSNKHLYNSYEVGPLASRRRRAAGGRGNRGRLLLGRPQPRCGAPPQRGSC
jgi:hypothetical protein